MSFNLGLDMLSIVISPSSVLALITVFILVIIGLTAPDAPTHIGEFDTEFTEFDDRRCTGITTKGEYCKNWRKVGFSQCQWHIPGVPGGARLGKCTGILRNSRRCRFRAKY